MIEKSLLGTAYGIVNCLSNGGIYFIYNLIYINLVKAIIFIIIGELIDATSETEGGYYWFLMFFLILSVITIFISLYILIYDRYGNGDVFTKSGQNILRRCSSTNVSRVITLNNFD